MNIQDLLQWWNLIYAAPLLISVAWILTVIFSGMQDHAHSLGHDVAQHIGHVAHDVTHSIGHGDHGNLGHGHAHTGHGDAGHEHSHGHSHPEDTPSRMIMLLGLDRVPITLLAGIFLMCWGAFGLFANQVFDVLKYPAIYIWPSMGATFVVSSILTRAMASILGRLLPDDENYGVSRFDLCGSIGKTVYSTTETAGTVDIKDGFGTVHRVQAKTDTGQEAIPANTEVIVVDFDEDDKRYVVRRGTI